MRYGILFFFLLVIFNSCNYSQITENNNSVLEIHELKEIGPNSGNFIIGGYVVKIYTCPPCLRGELCKPCMKNNIVISEDNKILETYSLTAKELIVFIDDPRQFELGKKYRFSIKILKQNSTGEPVNDIELLNYELIV